MAGTDENWAAALAKWVEFRAASLARAGRLQEAEEFLHEFAAGAPRHLRPRLLLARILGQQGRYTEALTALEEMEGTEGERLRERLRTLASRGGRPVRLWRLAVIGAVPIVVAALAVGVLYVWLAGSHGPTAVEQTMSATELEALEAMVDRDVPTVEMLVAWARLAQELAPLPPAHQVHFRPEIRHGSVVAVLEGEVISESIRWRIRDAVTASGFENDLTRLEVTDAYTVSAGETLSLIAWRVYGESAQWPAVWAANREAVADPDQILPGMHLVIP